MKEVLKHDYNEKMKIEDDEAVKIPYFKDKKDQRKWMHANYDLAA